MAVAKCPREDSGKLGCGSSASVHEGNGSMIGRTLKATPLAGTVIFTVERDVLTKRTSSSQTHQHL